MRYRFQAGEQVYEVNIERRGSRSTPDYAVPPSVNEWGRERVGSIYRATVDGQPYDLELLDAASGQLSLRFSPAGPGEGSAAQERRSLTLYWADGEAEKWVSLDGCTYRLEKPSRKRPRGASTEAAGTQVVRAPMPAQVRLVQVAEGDVVEKGQTLLLLEAMKMEIRIRAPAAGRLTRLLVAAGQTVEKDQALAEMGE